MTEKMEVFELDDDFDPMADVSSDELQDDEEMDALSNDYMAPIPDADKSVIPPKREVSAEERIAQLIVGLPGQKFRLLQAIDACRETRTLDELCASMEAAFPVQKTVFDAPQIVRLLAEAGAIDVQEVPLETADDQPESADADFIQVKPVSYNLYTASAAGLAAVEEGSGERVVLDMLGAEEDRYLPLFKQVLEMTAADGGCTAKELDLAISTNPICAEPRRYAGYFMNLLENTFAIQWTDAWSITETGRSVLQSDIFA